MSLWYTPLTVFILKGNLTILPCCYCPLGTQILFPLCFALLCPRELDGRVYPYDHIIQAARPSHLDWLWPLGGKKQRKEREVGVFSPGFLPALVSATSRICLQDNSC